MPYAALRPCSYCHIKLEVRGNHGRCEDHPIRDAHIPEHQKLYNTRRWKRIRARQLAKDPFCSECDKEHITTIATHCDHIEPHRGDPVKFFSGPFQSLCDHHHGQKTAEEVGWGGVKKVSDLEATSGRGH